MPLGMAARMWPTPNANDWKHPGLPTRDPDSTSAHGLAARVLWPTPSAGGSHSIGRLDEWAYKKRLTKSAAVRELLGEALK